MSTVQGSRNRVKREMGKTSLKVGPIVKHLRKLENATLDQMGELLGINRMTVFRYESGKAKPEPVMLKRLAEVAMKFPEAEAYVPQLLRAVCETWTIPLPLLTTAVILRAEHGDEPVSR